MKTSTTKEVEAQRKRHGNAQFSLCCSSTNAGSRVKRGPAFSFDPQICADSLSGERRLRACSSGQLAQTDFKQQFRGSFPQTEQLRDRARRTEKPYSAGQASFDLVDRPSDVLIY